MGRVINAVATLGSFAWFVYEVFVGTNTHEMIEAGLFTIINEIAFYSNGEESK